MEEELRHLWRWAGAGAGADADANYGCLAAFFLQDLNVIAVLHVTRPLATLTSSDGASQGFEYLDLIPDCVA